MNADHLIDDVARELTGAAPRPELRERVMEALGPQQPSLRAHVTLLSTAATLVVGILAAAVTWQIRSAVVVPDDLTRTPTPLVSAPVIQHPAFSATHPPVKPSGTTAAAAPIPVVVPSADVLAWQARAVQPLPFPAPLALADDGPAATVDPLFEIAPLVTEPLVLAPLELIDSGGA